MLAQQVRRMLKDPKSRALVDNFASQWLMLRNLKSHQPNPRDFPNFDNELRQAFRQETELFFESIMREDRSVIDLLDAELHLRQRAAGAALRHSERLRQLLPSSDAERSGAPRPARAGQHPDDHVVSEPHVAGAARQVDPREHPRHAALGTAAERADAEGERRSGTA